MDTSRSLGSDDEEVVLVDAEDRELGRAPKLEVHRTGAMHRAVSVFLFDGAQSLLLQRRAATKYHCPGLWSNTCCGHPRPGEAPLVAARRRLKEEMGIECDIFPALRFQYFADVGNGLVENELDHVYFGYFDGKPAAMPSEVSETRWMPLDQLLADVVRAPSEYTPWLGLALRLLERRGIP